MHLRPVNGPGQIKGFKSIYVSPSDQIHVFDWGQRRWLTVTNDGTPVSTAAISAVPHSMAFPGGQSVVLQTMFFTPEAIGFPLQLMREDGTMIRSLGADPPIYVPTASLAARERVGRLLRLRSSRDDRRRDL